MSAHQINLSNASALENVKSGMKLTDFTSSPNLAPFIVSLMLMFGQQLSGMNAVMFYCVDIFKVDIHKFTITLINSDSQSQIDIFKVKIYKSTTT